MPIKDSSVYPDDWDSIREAILWRSTLWVNEEEPRHGLCRCECEGDCGKVHVGYKGDEEHNEYRCREIYGHQGQEMNGKVILTVAHLDHDASIGNHADENLKAMCQACHLRFDSEPNRLRRTGQPRLLDPRQL